MEVPGEMPWIVVSGRKSPKSKESTISSVMENSREDRLFWKINISYVTLEPYQVKRESVPFTQVHVPSKQVHVLSRLL